MKHHALISRLWRTALFAGLAAPALVPAQTETTPSYLPGREEPVLLDKLTVGAAREDETYSVQRSFAATKTDTPLVNVPQSVSVITRELIEDQGMQGVGDVTRYVPGVGIAQGEGNRDTPVLRGNSSTADFFIDGVRDDVQYYRDLYNVDRVEVMKGPNAMIFGRGGSGGLINRVTKQASGANFNELFLHTGSFSQARATLDSSRALDHGVAVRLTGLFENSGSYRDDVTLRRHGLNPTLTWRVAPNSILRVGYEYFHDDRVADRGIPSFAGRPVSTNASTFFGDPAQSQARATVNSGFAILDHAFTNGASLRNHTRFGRYAKFYQNVFPGAVNAAGTSVALSAYSNGTDRDNLFNETDLVVPFRTGSVGHQILAGLELARQETENLRVTGYFTSVSPTATSVSVPLKNPRYHDPITFRPGATDADNAGVATSAAVYVQDQITFSPHWQAVAGVRWERFAVDFTNHRAALALDSRDDLVSPRAGLIYKPAPGLSLYTSYSLSHLPRAGEQLSSLSLTNRSLDPEEFRNHEIGLKWEPRSDLALSVAAYRLDRHNVIITDPANPTRSLLVDGQRAEGVEVGINGRLTHRWSLAGGYAYQDGSLRSTQSSTAVAGARLAQLPRHTLSLWQRYDLTRTWGVGAGAIYRDAIFASTDHAVKVPGFVRFDAALFWRLSAKLRLQFNVENVFNRDYHASAHSNSNIMPGSPRALRISATTRF
jgi:catecholate siderophore receptor